MTPDMVQARRLAALEIGIGTLGVVPGVERGAHFDVIQQRHTAVCLSLAIDRCPRHGSRTSGILGRQQQKERQQQGHVTGHGRQRRMNHFVLRADVSRRRNAAQS
jgi:hypothetical protein